MSSMLSAGDPRNRGRSKSPGRRDARDRSRSRVAEVVEKTTTRTQYARAPSPPSSRHGDTRFVQDDQDEHSRKYQEITTTTVTRENDHEDRYRRGSSTVRNLNYAVPDAYGETGRVIVDRRTPGDYGPSDTKNKNRYTTHSDDSSPERRSGKATEYKTEPRRVINDSHHSEVRSAEPDRYARRFEDPRMWHERERSENDLAYGEAPTGSNDSRHRYAEYKAYEYAQLPEEVKYVTKEKITYDGVPRSSQTYINRSQPSTLQPRVVTADPAQRRPSGVTGLAPGMSSLSLNTPHHSLQVVGGHTSSSSLANAPGSPLLESYHGTWQSISPMPSPLLMASRPQFSEVDLVNVVALKKARFYDAADDAARIAKALKGNKEPDASPLIEILPALTHEQVMELRSEYKKLVKTGSERKGVNVAKHIKLRLKEENPSLMKACYATALGHWESEAYWANFWYQGEKSRRELLIESLMGRTNAEIKEIKDGFSDKKYGDSLSRCMKTELKEDKFKKAVLLVLEERRQEDVPAHLIDMDFVEDDVRKLRKAVRSEKGGETAMIEILVRRSDNHIRAILKLYDEVYHANFPREMLKKSGNLVGELLAHILNGVINRPVRDALLVNHALSLTKSDSIRTELLISRLVRIHWDAAHMEAVKREYKNRYGRDLQLAVREGTRGDWGRFCQELTLKRTRDDVRILDHVEIVRPA